MQGESHSEKPEQCPAILSISAPQLTTMAAPRKGMQPMLPDLLSLPQEAEQSRFQSNPDLYVVSPNFKRQPLDSHYLRIL